jgi:hypothetical protein
MNNGDDYTCFNGVGWHTSSKCFSPQRRRDAEKIFFSAAKLAKMRKIKKTKKTLFFALFAFFAAKDILKSFHCVSARRPA